MTWRSYFKTKTRQPEFLWRMVIWILAAGIGFGYAAEKVSNPPQQPSVESTPKNEAWKQVKALAEQGEWWQLWWALPAVTFRRFDLVGPLALAIVAGCCWFLFLWQALKTPGLRSPQLWCALLAICLGILSIWPTHFFSLWQEYGWGLREDRELIPGLRFYIFGVGLPEELAKLICVLPLMPWLLRMRSALAALMMSGCVGLGFAIAENINYFAYTGGISTMARFLTANPMHITLTGLAGLTLYRTLRNPQAWAAHAVGIFGVLVFAHGLYDAFQVLPALADYSLFAMIIFALVVYQFFRELRELRPAQGDTISLSANFLFGVCVLTSTTFVYLCANLGIGTAFDMLVNSVTSLAIMVYLFLREMPETMVTV